MEDDVIAGISRYSFEDKPRLTAMPVPNKPSHHRDYLPIERYLSVKQLQFQITFINALFLRILTLLIEFG